MASNFDSFMTQILTENTDRINSVVDVAVAFAHAYLLHKGLLADHGQQGNSIPDSWGSGEEDARELHYKHEGKTYILKGLRVEGTICFYFYDSAADKMRELNVNVENHFFETGQFKDLISSHQFNRIFKDTKKLSLAVGNLISHVKLPPQGSQESKGEPSSSKARNTKDTRVEEPRHPQNPLFVCEHRPRFDPYGYGQADILPGGLSPGGMIFDPLRSPGAFGGPGAAFPGRVPGARFDPVGPFAQPDVVPGPRRPRRRNPGDPDPDHLRRPGFDDDMFM